MSEEKPQRRCCDRHRNRRASHYCEACDADRCVLCVFEPEESRGTTEDFQARCGKCGSYVRVIYAHRADNKSYLARILAAPLYPLNSSGAMLLLTTAVFTYFLEFILCVGGLLGWAILWSLFFGLLRQTALGMNSPEVPDFSSVWNDLFVPLGRGIAATALLWLPASLYLYWRLTNLVGVQIEEPLEKILFVDPVLWLIVFAGVLYMPMALVIAGLGGNVIQMLNPVRILGFAIRIPRDYLIAVVATVAVGVMWFLLVSVVGARVVAIEIPIIPGVLVALLGIYPLFVAARVLGLLAFVHGDRFEYGDADDYLEPAVADLRPLGKPSGSLVGAAKEQFRDPTSVAFGAEEIGSAGAAAIGITAAAPAWQGGESAAIPLATDEAILAALELRDFPAAIALYREAAGGDPRAVEPPTHIEVGRAAAGTGDIELARWAFEAACLHPSHEAVPRAMVLLARLYLQRFDDPTRAAALFRQVVDRFPGTPAAEFAEKQLGQV